MNFVIWVVVVVHSLWSKVIVPAAEGIEGEVGPGRRKIAELAHLRDRWWPSKRALRKLGLVEPTAEIRCLTNAFLCLLTRTVAPRPSPPQSC